MRSPALGFVCVLFALPVWAEAPPIRPGMWEFSMVGLPHKQQLCIKPDMVKDIEKLTQQNDPNSDCKTSDQSAKGSVQSFKVSCTKPHKYQATVTMNLMSPDNFSVQNDYSIEQAGRTQKGTLKINYKRLGDC